MKKKLVFVVQVDVDKHLDGNVVKAMDAWRWEMLKKYGAIVRVDEVKLED